MHRPARVSTNADHLAASPKTSPEANKVKKKKKKKKKSTEVDGNDAAASSPCIADADISCLAQALATQADNPLVHAAEEDHGECTANHAAAEAEVSDGGHGASAAALSRRKGGKPAPNGAGEIVSRKSAAVAFGEKGADVAVEKLKKKRKRADVSPPQPPAHAENPPQRAVSEVAESPARKKRLRSQELTQPRDSVGVGAAQCARSAPVAAPAANARADSNKPAGVAVTHMTAFLWPAVVTACDTC